MDEYERNLARYERRMAELDAQQTTPEERASSKLIKFTVDACDLDDVGTGYTYKRLFIGHVFFQPGWEECSDIERRRHLARVGERFKEGLALLRDRLPGVPAVPYMSTPIECDALTTLRMTALFLDVVMADEEWQRIDISPETIASGACWPAEWSHILIPGTGPKQQAMDEMAAYDAIRQAFINDDPDNDDEQTN